MTKMTPSLNVIPLLAIAAASGCRAPTRDDPRPQPKSTAAATAQTIPPPLATTGPSLEASSPPACVRVGGSIREPRKVHHKHAELSEATRSVSTHGGVLIYDATIDEQGQVRDVHLLKPVDSAAPWPEIERAWRTAIAKWRYEPTLVNGKASRVCMTMSVIIDVR